MNLTVIASFTKIHEAYFAKNHLEIEGIEPFVFDEFLIGVHRLYSNAVGGVKVAVDETNIEKAKLIIDNYIKEQNEYLVSLEHICPKCNSRNIREKSTF